jgi:hypothetical protein
MKIALDFDNTFTLDPAFWFEFIELCRVFNVEVFIVTVRDSAFDRCELLDEVAKQVDVYYTDGVAKKWWMTHFAMSEHRTPDIWIDDKPESVLSNSPATPEFLALWRSSGANKIKAA